MPYQLDRRKGEEHQSLIRYSSITGRPCSFAGYRRHDELDPEVWREDRRKSPYVNPSDDLAEIKSALGLANEEARRFKESAIRAEEEKFQQAKNRRMSQMLKQMDKQAVIIEILDKYVQFFLNKSETPRIIAKEILAAISTPDGLTEIKSALGLPDDTSEPLVGLIWGLEQRIEDLEAMQMPSMLKSRRVE